MLLEVKRAHGKRRGQERRALQREALDVGGLRQPKERTIRYADMRSAMAEEGVVRLLFLDGSLARRCESLSSEDFSSPPLGKVYQAQLEAYAQNRSLHLAALAESCTPEEMSHLTTVLHKPEALANADRSLSDYIRVIQEAADKRRGVPDADPLLAAMDKYKEKKGQWRKAR